MTDASLDDLRSRIRDLDRRLKRIQSEVIHFADFFLIDERRGVEILDFTGDFRGVIGGIKLRIWTNSAFACLDGIPEIGNAVSYRVHRSYAGNHYAL